MGVTFSHLGAQPAGGAGSTEGCASEVGDTDASGVVNFNDGITILRWAFLGDPANLAQACAPVQGAGGAAGAVSCAAAISDADASGDVTFNDGIAILRWAFLSDPETLPVFCPGYPSIPGFALVAVNPQGYPEYRHYRTGIEFVRLPGGTFEMGSTPTEHLREDGEGPVHTVTLDPFLLGKTEVTQAQYNTIMLRAFPWHKNPSLWLGDDRRPIDSMSWDIINAPGYFLDLTGLSLPTEAQWEYACRGGTTTTFFFGDECNENSRDACHPAIDFMWWRTFTGDSRPTEPVGTKLPNPFGLFDMHGNVWEWCEDSWDIDFYSKPEATEPNPMAIVNPNYRVLRGGSAASVIPNCRSAMRHSEPRFQIGRFYGFRVAAPLP